VLNILGVNLLLTSSLAVFEAAMTKINASDKIMFENQKKKRKYENKTTCKRSLRHRIHSLLRPADARGSADIIYLI